MDNYEQLRAFIISYLKRFAYEIDFLSRVVEQNPLAFDNAFYIESGLYHRLRNLVSEIVRTGEESFLDEYNKVPMYEVSLDGKSTLDDYITEINMVDVV